MTYKEARDYLQPIADSAQLPGYAEALANALEALERADRYKQLYIDLLKTKDDDICEKCKHERHCDGKNCPGYIEGRGGELDGKWVDFRWTREELDWGSCPMLEDTPCHGCLAGSYSGFELKEEK